MTKLLAAFFAIATALSAGSARGAATLNPDITITGDVIRLGDLFADAGAEAKDPVAAAPSLGMRATYSAAWLKAVAREHHLAWTPGSDFDQAVVTRASRYIDADTIERRLLDAMASSIAGNDAELRLDNPAVRLLVPAEASDTLAVEGLNLDARSGRFSAYISPTRDALGAQRLRVTGRLVVEVTVAVPSHAIATNQILGAADIERIKLPRERLALDTLTDPGQLIGKSAVHALRADQPVRAGDVQEPILVHRGDLVTIELRTPSMALTAQGKALEDGGAGASIRVTNTQSKRVVDVSVEGPGLVRAGTLDKFAAR
ncbi:MAG TPA: flagellar basal body P-ring formation chaperone FlgA [Stellaceae bacterium]|nr:flagellar basal body P-ring formation chaperone FlgA [Stellaceae bacterium]